MIGAPERVGIYPYFGTSDREANQTWTFTEEEGPAYMPAVSRATTRILFIASSAATLYDSASVG